MSYDRFSASPPSSQESAEGQFALSRRGFLAGAGVAGVAAVSHTVRTAAATGEGSGTGAPGDGTPEQIHLTWGDDPSTTVNVSWCSAAQSVNPRVELRASSGGPRTVAAIQRLYTDGLSGLTVFTYHARLEGLEPGASYSYIVTADNSRHGEAPFTASFRSAPRGRVAFRWTSYGDLATPVTTWQNSSAQSRFAVQAVERFAPLFHLLNGDLCYANVNPSAQPAVWADFGRNVQASAAYRPWMPCPGNHEIEFCNGEQGFDSYRTRYSLPDNGTAFPGRWYCFRVGTALFISLSADDVIYQEGGPLVTGPAALQPNASTGHTVLEPGASIYLRGYSGGAQTRWLEQTLAQAATDRDLDWIIVQMHQDALSSARNGNGSDRGIREAWLPLFDRHGVDLVLCGHDHDYERSWPVRGFNPDAGTDIASGATVDTRQPRPVQAAAKADGSFDTTFGTIHFILGGGGTSLPTDLYGAAPSGAPQAKVFTLHNPPLRHEGTGTFYREGADAVEPAIWSARRDTGTGYGVAVFDLDPNVGREQTAITIRYYHAPGAERNPTADYELFETVVLRKRRRAVP